ncbi:MAG: hypothetical protein [Cressdnaviricota sp.]|nr:MAG: hypothetical protein [Cressdnaviricota sp.]
MWTTQRITYTSTYTHLTLSTRELSAGLRQTLSRMDYLLIVPPLAGDSEQLSAPERSEGRAGMLARGEQSPRTTQISYNTTLD